MKSDPEIAQKSIYEYGTGWGVLSTQKKDDSERMNQIDEKYLDMKGYNCMAVVSSMTYNAQGIMFDLPSRATELDRFVFYDLLIGRSEKTDYDTISRGILSP